MNIDVILHFEIGPFIIYDGCYCVPVSFRTGRLEGELLISIGQLARSIEIPDSSTNVPEEHIPLLEKKKKYKKLMIHGSKKYSGSK